MFSNDSTWLYHRDNELEKMALDLYHAGLFTPEEMSKPTNTRKIQNIILKYGLQRLKTKYLQDIATKVLAAEEVPMDFELLTKMVGVGEKVANIFLGEVGHYPAGVGVDVHVGRIACALDWVPPTTGGPTAFEKIQGLHPAAAQAIIKGYSKKVGNGIAMWLEKEELSNVNRELAGLGQLLGNVNDRQDIHLFIAGDLDLTDSDRIEMHAIVDVLDQFYSG